MARMLALCVMGRERAARVRAQSFLAAHPDSAFVGRVKGMCTQNASHHELGLQPTAATNPITMRMVRSSAARSS